MLTSRGLLQGRIEIGGVFIKLSLNVTFLIVHVSGAWVLLHLILQESSEAGPLDAHRTTCGVCFPGKLELVFVLFCLFFSF